jgi:hypothetical protein
MWNKGRTGHRCLYNSRMRLAWWINKAKYTHSESLFFLLIDGNFGYKNTPRYYVCMYIACLVELLYIKTNTFLNAKIHNKHMQNLTSFTLSHILDLYPFANYELLVTAHFVVQCYSFRKIPTSFGLLWAGVRSLVSTQVLVLFQFLVQANFPSTCLFL